MSDAGRRDYEALISAFLDGACSPEEAAELDRWVAAEP